MNSFFSPFVSLWFLLYTRNSLTKWRSLQNQKGDWSESCNVTSWKQPFWPLTWSYTLTGLLRSHCPITRSTTVINLTTSLMDYDLDFEVTIDWCFMHQLNGTIEVKRSDGLDTAVHKSCMSKNWQGSESGYISTLGNTIRWTWHWSASDEDQSILVQIKSLHRPYALIHFFILMCLGYHNCPHRTAVVPDTTTLVHPQLCHLNHCQLATALACFTLGARDAGFRLRIWLSSKSSSWDKHQTSLSNQTIKYMKDHESPSNSFPLK